MDKFTFPSQFPGKTPKPTKQTFYGPSMTEPDNSMSIPEIIARYTRGQGIQVNQRAWQQGVALEENETQVDPAEFDFMPGYVPSQEPQPTPVDPKPAQDPEPPKEPEPPIPAPTAPAPASA